MAIKYEREMSASEMVASMTNLNNGNPAVVKVAEGEPSGKLKKALDIISKIETEKREPKKPLSEKKAQVGARISEDAINAIRGMGGKYADHIEAAVVEYALRHGVL